MTEDVEKTKLRREKHAEQNKADSSISSVATGPSFIAACYLLLSNQGQRCRKIEGCLGFQLFLQPTPSVKTRPSDIRIFMHAQSSSVLTFNFAVGGRSPWTENLGDKYGTSRCFNCGNGIIDAAETCDDSNTVDGDGSLAALGQ